MESRPWPSLDSFSVPFAKQFLRLNLLMITLPFDLVIDLLQMVYIATKFIADGSSVVTASWSNIAKIWNAATGECMNTLTGHSICECIRINWTFSQMDLQGSSLPSSDIQWSWLPSIRLSHCRWIFSGHRSQVQRTSNKDPRACGE